MPKPKGTLDECQDCKYCNLEGEYGPECEALPPQEITFLHPHPWPLIANLHHKPCGVAISRYE